MDTVAPALVEAENEADVEVTRSVWEAWIIYIIFESNSSALNQVKEENSWFKSNFLCPISNTRI